MNKEYFFSSLKIEDRSYSAFAKREVHQQAVLAGFPPNRVAEIDIIVSEMLSNITKHAGGGELLYRLRNLNPASSFELFTLDKGPGITNVNQMMKDGVSTARTLGQGLGAIRRLSQSFQIFSQQNWGTIVSSKGQEPVEPAFTARKNDLNVQTLFVPKLGEKVCGDGYHVKRTGDAVQIFLGDGLGHGEHAHAAVLTAMAFLDACEETEPTKILRLMHQEVKKTRGLVGSIARLDFKTKSWQICGIGNIHTTIQQGLVFKSCMSYNGVIGLNIPNTFGSHKVAAENNQVIIMSSDGLKSRWDFSKYPMLSKYDLSILTAVLYKDFNRGTDDSSVLAGKVIFSS